MWKTFQFVGVDISLGLDLFDSIRHKPRSSNKTTLMGGICEKDVSTKSY